MATGQLILSIAAIVICFFTLLAILREFHCEQEYTVDKPSKFILISTYLSIIFFLSSMVSSTINLANPPSFAQDIIDDSITIILWSIAQLFTYIIILSRIHFTLSNTRYQLKEHNYIIFTILIFVCILLCIVWILRSILYHNQYINGDISEHNIHEFSVFFVTLVEIIDLTISIFFISIFVNRLKMIINQNKLIQSKKHQTITNNMLKYWVLSLFIIISTQIVAFVACIMFVTEYIDDQTAFEVFEIMYEIFLPLNPIIITFSIFLMFETYHEYYDKRCGCCDNLAMKCFDKLSQKRKYKISSDGQLNQSLLVPNDNNNEL